MELLLSERELRWWGGGLSSTHRAPPQFRLPPATLTSSKFNLSHNQLAECNSLSGFIKLKFLFLDDNKI